jgi:hypothetical protein
MSLRALALFGWQAFIAAPLLACSASSPEQPVQLGEGTVALVGGEARKAQNVLSVAELRGVEPKAAAEWLVNDALLAQGARELLPPGVLAAVERSVLARALIEDLRSTARSSPPLESEAAAVEREHWVALDRPESAEVVHAVVLVDAPEQKPEARQVAEAIRQAVAGAKSAEEFLEMARGVPHQGLRVQAESLPPVTGDGRTVQLDSAEAELSAPQAPKFDEEFARVANSLKEPGELSPVSETRFGYHVLRLERRHEAHRAGAEERQAFITREVTLARLQKAYSVLLSELQKGGAALERSALERLKLLPVEP